MIAYATTDVIGRVSLVPDGFPEANITQAMALIRVHDPEIKPSVLFAFLTGRYGALQIKRLARPTGQYNLNLQEVASLRIPFFSINFSGAVTQSIRTSHDLMHRCSDYHKQSEQILLRALGLENWQPPEPLTYTRRASEAFAAGRFDAEHFQEKFYAARRHLSEVGALEFLPLASLLATLTNGHTPLHHDLSVGEVPFLCAEHVSDFVVNFASAKRILAEHHHGELSRTALQEGDVLLTIKGRVGNVAVVEKLPGLVNINQDVALLRFNDRLPLWYVLSFLNSPFGKLQTEQMCTGGINPFLGLSNVRRLEIPRFAENVMVEIGEQTRNKVHEARTARRQAHTLLEAAKHAVEIAIEQSEAEALAYLKEHGV